MDIKKKYERARFLNNKIDRLKEELESLEIDISAIDTTRDAVQTSNLSDLSDKAIKINDLIENINECIDEVNRYKNSVRCLLDNLENEDEYNVMFYKYIMFMRGEEIAIKMNYSKRWVDKIHGYALQKIRK